MTEDDREGRKFHRIKVSFVSCFSAFSLLLILNSQVILNVLDKTGLPNQETHETHACNVVK